MRIKKSLFFIIALLTVVSALTLAFGAMRKTEVCAVTKVYIGSVALPLDEYPPGTFFSKNGKACTCHDDNSIDCIASGRRCSCLRYIDIGGGKKYDLLASQCFGFARYVQYRVFGHIDAESSRFYSVGSLSRGKVTASSVKALIAKAKPGAHIRLKLSASSHSAILLSSGSSGFTVYHANAGGDGVTSRPCVVSTKYYTYEDFAAFAYRGIEYVKLPYNYPGEKEKETTVTDSSDKSTSSSFSKGIYKASQNLYLRKSPSLDSSSLTIVPKGESICVTDTSSEWGKTRYDGKEGWVRLSYAEKAEPPRFKSEGRIIYSLPCGTTAFELICSLETYEKASSVKVRTQNGDALSDADIIGTGYTAEITVNGEKKAYRLSVTGDINGDRAVDANDTAYLKKCFKDGAILSGSFLKAADLNGDGRTSMADYISIKRRIKR